MRTLLNIQDDLNHICRIIECAGLAVLSADRDVADPIGAVLRDAAEKIVTVRDEIERHHSAHAKVFHLARGQE